MKEFKKRWEDELERKLPNLRQEILDEPIPQRATNVKRRKPVFKYLSVISSVAAVIVICICVIPLLRVQEQNQPLDTPSTSATSASTLMSTNVTASSTDTALQPGDTTEKEASTILTVEINPRVMFVSNKYGIVTSVIATNADADIVLSCDGFEESIIGKQTAQALVAYVDLVTQLGYIDAGSTDNTVKITACGDSDTLVEAKESLENHFKSNGVSAAVVENTATVDEICEINELEKADKVEDIVDKFKDKSPLYSERKFDELEGEELESYYKETVINSVKDDIESALDEISVILDISELNSQIMQMCLGADYWMIKEFAFIEPSLNEIILKTEEKLKLFEESYGYKIESGIQLNEIASQFTKEYINELKESLEAFEHTEDYKAILDALDKDISAFDKLDNIPATKEEIKKENENALKQEGNDRIEQNKGWQENKNNGTMQEENEKNKNFEN